MTAVSDVDHWRRTVRREIAHLEQVHLLGFRVTNRTEPGPISEEAAEALSDSAATKQFIIIAAHHLMVALESGGLPESLKAVRLDPELVRAIETLRHLYEHWPEQRQGEPPETRNKTRRRYDALPGAGAPWSSAWNRQSGHTIGGVLKLEDLEAALDRIEGPLLQLRGAG
jgi:hypothetical protein